jgi:hypothetical protein
MREKCSALATCKALIALTCVLTYSCGAVAKAGGDSKPASYVGRVMLEIIMFFPKEFEQLDEKGRREIKEAMKREGAQEFGNEMRMPKKPLIGAFLKLGNQSIMTDTKGEFVLPALPPDITDIPICQQLSDKVPMAQFPVKRLYHQGENVQPFVISIRTPFGECHAGKLDHTN